MKNYRSLSLCFLTVFLLTGALFSNSSGPKKFAKGLKIESQDERDAFKIDRMPLVESGGKELPAAVDLSPNMPPVGNQGEQGSCTAWSTTYYVKSYHEKIKNKWNYGWGHFDPFYKETMLNPDKGTHVFSPAWTYNQLNGGKDEGACISDAMRLLRDKGAVPWSVMPYDHKNFRNKPDRKARRLAYSKFRSKKFKAVDTSNPVKVKNELAKGNPLVGGFQVTDRWEQPSKNIIKGGVFDDHRGTVTGAHAMAVVGYDDDKVSQSGSKGAFKIINSWGTDWGSKGYFWMSYRSFALLCEYAYVLYDSDASSSIPSGRNMAEIKPTDMVSATRGIYADRINISWNRVKGAVSYIVERSPGNSSDFRRVSVQNSNKYTDKNIQPGFRYNYRIVTVASGGRSKAAASPVAEGFALKEKSSLPEQVTGLACTASSGSSVSMKWTGVQNAESYIIVRYNQKKKKWDTLGRVAGLSFKDHSPQKDAPNYYYVNALNRHGMGESSNLLTVTVSKKAGPPSIVDGVNASEGTYSDRIVVKWNRQPSASYYILYRWNNDKEDWDKYWEVTGSEFTDTDKEIRDGENHIYTLMAYNENGSSEDWSSYAEGYTSGVRVSSYSIPVPVNVKADVNKRTRKVTLSWKAPSGQKGFNVYRKKEGDIKFRRIGTLSPDTDSFSEKFPGTGKDIFMYYVTARGGQEESARSEIVTAAEDDFTPTVMTTFLPGDGLKNFRGIWRATHLKPDCDPVEMEITIADKGTEFKALIKYGKKRKEIKGAYASKSRYLQAGNFSFMMLPDFDNDVARAVIPAGVFTRSRIVVNFARENQD